MKTTKGTTNTDNFNLQMEIEKLKSTIKAQSEVIKEMNNQLALQKIVIKQLIEKTGLVLN